MDHFNKTEELSQVLSEGVPLLLIPLHVVSAEDTSCPSLILYLVYL